MIETISGIITAVIVIVLVQVLSKNLTSRFIAATVLVAIAFIYVGFSLKENPVSLVVLEIAVAVFFYFVAIIGYAKNGLIIAWGIILHGLWDIFHHNGLPIQTDIPGYYPTFCFVVDMIDGAYLLFLFRAQNRVDLLERTS